MPTRIAEASGTNKQCWAEYWDNKKTNTAKRATEKPEEESYK